MTEEEAIVVFTARSPQRIVGEGGSQAWRLSAARAKQAAWLIYTQNRNNPDHEFSDATEPHGAAFLVGKVSGVVKSPEGDDGEQRWLVTISEYALINVPDFWEHDRNPVRYLPRSELERKGIDFDALEFKPMPPEAPSAAASPAAPDQPAASGRVVPLTIAEARKGLAAAFGVKPEAIEITIRG